jgi:hypothetical protein
MKTSVNESEGPYRFRFLTACHELLHPIALAGRVKAVDERTEMVKVAAGT